MTVGGMVATTMLAAMVVMAIAMPHFVDATLGWLQSLLPSVIVRPTAIACAGVDVSQLHSEQVFTCLKTNGSALHPVLPAQWRGDVKLSSRHASTGYHFAIARAFLRCAVVLWFVSVVLVTVVA